MSLHGKTICFTGTLSLVRKDATAKAQAAGASVSGSVTNSTDILIAGAGAGAKEAAAKAKGVEVWTEAEFITALSGGGGSSNDGSASLHSGKPGREKKAPAATSSSKAAGKKKTEPPSKQPAAGSKARTTTAVSRQRSGELLSQGLGVPRLFETVLTSSDLVDLILEQGGLPAAAQPLCKAWAARAAAAIARWDLLTSEWTRAGVRVESEWIGSYTDDGDEGCWDGPYSLDALAEGKKRACSCAAMERKRPVSSRLDHPAFASPLSTPAASLHTGCRGLQRRRRPLWDVAATARPSPAHAQR